MENFSNYDKWKLAHPDHYDEPPEKHPLDLTDKIGDTVEFWWKNPRVGVLTQIIGVVYNTDAEGVWINFMGNKTYYCYDDMRVKDSLEGE